MPTTNAYNAIADLETYTARMGKGVIDKLFFVDKIDPDVIVDFGAADGLLIQNMEPWFPAGHFIGFDIDEKMVSAALSRFTDEGDRFMFLASWEHVEAQIAKHRAAGHKVAVVLSSIVHEIYHYQEPHEIDQFRKRIFGAGFDFIVLRDMIPARSIDRSSDINDVARVYRKYLNTQQLQDFENAWGSIENNRKLTHFLLKYKYQVPNWDREVKENYLPLHQEDLLAMVPATYYVIYHEKRCR